MNTMGKALAVSLVLSPFLAGCAVYGPPPVYSQGPYYETPVYAAPAPVYVRPAPVYVQPAPVYVEPPVSFRFNFGYWGGGHRHWR